MTILWMDGFDLYTGAGDLSVNYNTNAPGFTTTNGRFGGGAWQGGGYNNGDYAIKLLGASYADMWVSFAGNGVNGAIVAVGAGSSNNNGQESYLFYNTTTGQISLIMGSGRTLISGPLLATVGWHWFDIHLTYSATAGVAEIWVDNVQVASGTGLNTIDNTGYSGYLNVGLFGNGGLIDDLFVYTPGTRLGDSRIETVRPASDASPNNGTPSTGTSHYAMVNETQYDTSNYITLPNTSGDKEVFTVGSLSGTPVSVWAVKVETWAQKSDAGSYTIEPLVISGTTEGDGSSQPLLTSYSEIASIFATNPATSAAWTYSAVNAMKIGVKVP